MTEQSTDTATPYNLVSQMMDYEMGEMSGDEILELFGHLIASGTAWTLQGHYGRQAQALIEDGWIDGDGTVLRNIYDEE